MKKVKVMLTAITVMAVVGGALAFKAKTFAQGFCTRKFSDGPGVCQGGYIGKIAFFAGDRYFTRPTSITTRCVNTDCNVPTSLTFIEP